MSASKFDSSESDGSSPENNDQFELKVAKKKVTICFPTSTKTIKTKTSLKSIMLLQRLFAIFLYSKNLICYMYLLFQVIFVPPIRYLS